MVRKVQALALVAFLFSCASTPTVEDTTDYKSLYEQKAQELEQCIELGNKLLLEL